MTPDEAQRAALQSFGDLERVKHSCCEIRRSLPFDSTAVRMGLHIAIALLAGWAALWAVNMRHDNFIGVLRQLIPIIVLTYLFALVWGAKRSRRFDGAPARGLFITNTERSGETTVLASDTSEISPINIAAHDKQGCTPLERVFKS